jgi:putative ABC transport system permease protein
MIFLKLIFTNLLRHRVRTLVSIAGIALSVAAVLTVVTILQGAVAMFSGILSNDSELVVSERNVSDLFFSNVSDDAVAQIGGWPMVQHADAVLFGIVSSEDHPVITCFGVNAADARIQRATWLEGSRDSFAKNDSVVLGERTAESLHAEAGSQIQIGHGSFAVLGIIKTADGFEDGGVFMPLRTAQTFFHKQGVSSVATVKLRNRNDAAQFKRAVNEKYPSLMALEDDEFKRSYSQFRILAAIAWAAGGCGLLLGGLGVANTMIMSVFTRIREIAILRVNGFSNWQIAGMIFGESALLSLAGAAAGLVIGFDALFALKFVPALQGYVDPHLKFFVMLTVVALALVTGAAGALYPAYYAVRLQAVEALRFA